MTNNILHIPSADRDSIAAFLSELLDHQPNNQSWRIAIAIAAQSIRRGRYLTPDEQLANFRAAMSAPEDDPDNYKVPHP